MTRERRHLGRRGGDELEGRDPRGAGSKQGEHRHRHGQVVFTESELR